MATFGDMKTRIRDELDRNSTVLSDSILENAIKDAIKYYEVEHFDFNEQVRPFTLIANDALLALPSDYVQTISLTIVDNDANYPLEPRNYNELERFDLRTQARPLYYAYFGGVLRLYPYPDEAYDGYLSYIKKFTVLADDGDSNAWTDNAEVMIREMAKSYVYRNKLKDFDRAVMHQSFSAAELQRLAKRSTANKSSGRLVIDYV